MQKDNSKGNILLSTAYWPPLEYFYYLFNSDTIYIEKWEHYEKQSYRNRCKILSANGPLELIIPVEKNSISIADVRISYKEKWQQNHWRAIESAYMNTAYFEYFKDEIGKLYEHQEEFLFEFNNKQLSTIFNILRIKKELHFTTTFEKEPSEIIDLRTVIHPKSDGYSNEKVRKKLTQRYYQVFEEKFGFQEDLSILDLLFHQGLGSLSHLKDE